MDETNFPVQIFIQKLIKLNLEVYYPVVLNLNNPIVQQRINTIISHEVNNLIYKQGYYQDPQTQVTGLFEIKSNERGILSINLSNYAYPPHAAHGMTYIKSLTMDIQTGKVYQLFELFKPDSNYVSIISNNIKKQIFAREIPLLDGFEKIKDNQDYYIADKAIVIYFQLYEITPYYIGFPMFPISVFELQNIAVPTGPIDVMATNS
jgi:hypothetical protein